MKLFNTLTRQKDEFVPIKPGEVSIYACGPTVYNFFHIGNARMFVVFDTMRRYFEYLGYKVNYVQNFTDVDDKMIAKANEEGVTVKDIAERYIAEYFTDAKGLNIKEATVHPKATENIDAIIDMVKTLIEKGHAYEVDGDVYFHTESDPSYGKLSHQPMEDLLSGARIDVDSRKKSPLDFALWKAQKPGEPAWESPWGMGRPGWHIECSAMATKYLGKTIDIHAGAIDLIFPHHENEIAQSECANGCTFVNYFVHNNYINVNNVKMSKSLGNFFTVRDVAAQYDYDVIRLFLISAHYKSPLNFSEDLMQSAKAALSRIRTAADNLAYLSQNAKDEPAKDEHIKALDSYRDKFKAGMDDDLNTADALGAIFELVRYVNSTAEAQNKNELAASLGMLTELCGVLGIKAESEQEILDEDIEKMIEERRAARAAKDFKKADEIRDKLKQMGIILEDTRDGVKWKKE